MLDIVQEKIVYLTPHCREDLGKWDHDAVYVVGALVDKSTQDPFSLAKAKKLGIKTRKLPLDHYLEYVP
jgi:ribonuclease P protein 1